MLETRLRAYKTYKNTPLPKWGPDLTRLNLKNIQYYLKPTDKPRTDWKDVPKEIKETFDRLGICEAEKEYFAGSGAQFESEMVYHSLKKDLKDLGVIFESTEQALQNHPKLFKKYFSKIVPASDNKFAALNTAVWSGGSFIYIPKGVHVDLLLHAYFRINAENMGQFERTLIVADEGSQMHYVEGCTAPLYSTQSLHAAVVEIVVEKNAHVQYTTLQNWANNINNLVTKRAHVHKNGEMMWLDCNLGSKINMKYPATYLLGEGAKGEMHSLAFAGKNQIQDTGGKMIHAAKNTSSKIVSKSISKDNGRASYRGLTKINKGATNSKNFVECHGLLLDNESKSDTYPQIQVEESDAALAHEATVSKISEDQLFYLKSRGLSEEEATSVIVNGFANPIIKQLPMEYAIEINRLIETLT